MAAVLGEQQLFFVIEEEPTEEDMEFREKDTLWVIDGEIIQPSTTLTLQRKLHPGVYRVDLSKDRGIFCKKISTTSDELFTFSDSKIPDLLEQISLFWDKAEAYKENKLIHKRGILLEGYPGTGKSSIITLLCDNLIKRNGIIFNITDSSNLSIYTSFIKNSFRHIEPDTPIITIIEDIDKYEESSVILDFLDGKSQIDHHLVIATTNNTKQIPDSFLRPSRIDLQIEVSLPNENTRREYFKNKNVNEELLEILVEKTDTCSLADLKEVYITMFLLDYTLDVAIDKVKNPQNKKDFSSKRLIPRKLGLN